MAEYRMNRPIANDKFAYDNETKIGSTLAVLAATMSASLTSNSHSDTAVSATADK